MVSIKNGYLTQIIEFMFNLALKGKQSRHRTKFVKLLNERLQEVAEQEKDLLKEHCYLDEQGAPKKVGENWDVKNVPLFLKDKKELYSEEFIIEGNNVKETLTIIKDIVFNYDEELSGNEAMMYDYLCDAFESIESGDN